MKAQRMLVGGLMVAVFVTCVAVGAIHALESPGEIPNLSIWENTWFKVKMTETVYHFSNIGVRPTPKNPKDASGGTSYVKITKWDITTTPDDPFLVVDVYAKESGAWTLVETLNIYYFAGNNLNFVGSAQVDDPAGTSLNLLFVFTGIRNKANTSFKLNGSTKLSTMGGAVFEIDDFQGSTERWAGSAALNGIMVPVSKLPLPLQGL